MGCKSMIWYKDEAHQIEKILAIQKGKQKEKEDSFKEQATKISSFDSIPINHPEYALFVMPINVNAKHEHN